jgi:ankyrin repeat protein
VALSRKPSIPPDALPKLNGTTTKFGQPTGELPVCKDPDKMHVKGKSEGQTTLHLTAENGHSTIVRCILEFGADIDARDASGSTALHLAVDQGHEDVVKVLLEEGADTDIRDHRGWTAMHTAGRNGCEPIIRLLIQRGADLNAEVKCEGRVR